MRGLATQDIFEEQFGRPRLLQTISLPNGTAIRSNELPKLARIMVQASVGTVFMAIGGSTVVVGNTGWASGGVGLLQGERYIFCLNEGETHLSFIYGASGHTVNIFIME